LLAAGILLNSACQVTPTEPPPSAAPAPSPAPRVDANAKLAAQIDEARSSIAAGEVEAARAQLATLGARTLPTPLRFTFDTARAELAIADGDLPTARSLVDGLQPVTDMQRRERALVAARLADAEGRPIDAARALMDVRLPGIGARDAQTITDEVWRSVSHAPPYRLAALAESAVTPNERGWWALADALQRSFDADAERAAFADWQRAFPGHPAAATLPRALTHLKSPAAPPRRIALLVPQTGPLAAAGDAIRDGFVAAHFHAGAQATVRIYDSATEPFAAIYARMREDGVDAIVGPLDKPSVTAANQHTDRALPTLALNYLPLGESRSADFYQIGVAVEDEAKAIASRLLADGLRRIALFSTTEDWSQRAARQIRTSLAGTRTLITAEGDVGDMRAITGRVGETLMVNASTERKDALESLLGVRLQFVTRRRDDVDAVVLLTDAVRAQALMPSLAYHFAANLPVYAPAQLVQGGASRDVNGVHVCVLPWNVEPDAVRDMVDDASGRVSALSALYALGADAFRIVERIGELPRRAGSASMHLLGSTGALTLAPDGQFRREPMWAVVRNGSIVAAPAAPR
jgi:hypothetical protein